VIEHGRQSCLVKLRDTRISTVAKPKYFFSCKTPFDLKFKPAFRIQPDQTFMDE